MSNSTDTTIAKFFIEPVHMTFKSNEAGRPIYEDREFVRILVPGDNALEIVREVRDEDKHRWHAEYAAFERGSSQEMVTGTPLSAVTWLTPSQVREFAGLNINSVEHLAGMSDAVIQKVGMGGRELRTKAEAYLTAANDSAAATKFASEVEALKAELDQLRQALADKTENSRSTKKAA